MQDATEAKERMEEALASRLELLLRVMAEARDSDPLVPSVPQTSDEEAEDGGLLSRDVTDDVL
jgi:hypothetical protein